MTVINYGLTGRRYQSWTFFSDQFVRKWSLHSAPGGTTYFVYESANQWLSAYVKGTEIQRWKINGNTDTLSDMTIGATLTISSIAAGTSDYDKFLVSDSGLVKYRTGAQVLSDIGASPSSHLHDGDTLQHDGVNSNGGAFSFNTTGNVTFNDNIVIDETLYLKERTNADSDITDYGQIWVRDLEPIELLFTTDEGSDWYLPLSSSIGRAPTFVSLSVGTGEVTCGSINRDSGNLTLEIGDTPVLTIGSGLITAAQSVEVNGTEITLDSSGDAKIYADKGASTDENGIYWQTAGSTKWDMLVSNGGEGSDNTLIVRSGGSTNYMTFGTDNGAVISHRHTIFEDNIGFGAGYTSNVAAIGIPSTYTALTGTSQYGIKCTPEMQSSATTAGYAGYFQLRTDDAAFTMPNGYGMYIDTPSVGAASTLTTNHGIYIANQTGGGTNYSLYTNTGTASLGDSLFLRNGYLHVLEVADADTRTAGYSQFYAANTEPSVPKFNDSDDNNWYIATSSTGGRAPTFVALTCANITVTSGDIKRASDSLTLRIADTAILTASATGITTTQPLTMTGSARVGKESILSVVSLAPGSSGASQTSIGNYPGWAFGINDDMLCEFEVPHDWDSSTDLEIKIYWGIDEAYAANSGEVQWEVSWSACPSDETEALDSPTHTGTIDYGDQNIPATAKYLTKTSAGAIAAASLSAGDLIGMTVKRIALDGGNNPTAEPVAVHIEVEYTANKLGEAV